MTTLDFIDGLRGIAILMVLVFHTSLAIANGVGFIKERILAENLSRGVQLFFIISAFAIFRSSDLRKGKDSSPVISFYIRRFFRIMPMWWIACIVYYFYGFNKKDTFDFFATFFMFFGFYFKSYQISIIPVGWSLFVEETFYWIFPLVKKVIRNIYVSFIFVIMSLVLSHLWINYSINKYQNSFFTSVFPLTYFFTFFIGIFLYYVYKLILIYEYKINQKYVFIGDVVSIILFLGIFYGNAIRGTCLLVPLVFMSLFKKSYLNKLYKLKFLRNLGKFSYSIYLFHPLIINKWIMGFNSIYSADNVYFEYFWLHLALHSIMIIIFCYYSGFLLFHYLEKTFIGMGKKVIIKIS